MTYDCIADSSGSMNRMDPFVYGTDAGAAAPFDMYEAAVAGAGHKMSKTPTKPCGSGSGRAGRIESGKSCGVCGDLAKSFHFGGLSCDSCKAFFRRSVQNDNYLNFHCCHQGNCAMTLTTRKSCQFCRMQRCFQIGMEKSWVMSEE